MRIPCWIKKKKLQPPILICKELDMNEQIWVWISVTMEVIPNLPLPHVVWKLPKKFCWE